MSLFIALFIGIAVGAGGSFFLTRNSDLLFINTLVGIVGSILGLAFYYFFLSGGLADAGLFSLPASLCSAIGACLGVLGFSSLHVTVDNPEERAAKSPKSPEKNEKEKIT